MLTDEERLTDASGPHQGLSYGVCIAWPGFRRGMQVWWAESGTVASSSVALIPGSASC